MYGKIQTTYKDKALHRLKIIHGAVRGLQKMVEDEAYCVDILTQSSAIQEALKSFDAVMLENHLSTHVPPQLTRKKKNKALSELLRLYKFSKK